MIKNIIAPIQTWLLSQGRCVGCGTPLIKGKKRGNLKQIITCKCGRIYKLEEKGLYRRARLDEV